MRKLIIVALVLTAARLSAQQWNWPETPKNLQVMKGFTGRQLGPVMRGFTRALGVRCTYCHVGEEGKPLSAYDFVSDANPNKDRARAMLRMLGSINDQLKTFPASSEKRVNMWCHTCHMGKPRPTSLDEEMRDAYLKSGINAAIARYHELREKYYGKGGYDFSDRALNSMGRELLEQKKPDEAIAIYHLSTTEYPQSAGSWDGLAEAYAAAGKPRIAAIYYRKSLELDPANENALAKLAEIEK
ncbi:MAG TPA: c-type cytochrome [Thermoanaerobaculia bacterium]|nr:c-type cytochrome [Thermoanaerobaculia bacterium]